MRAALLAVLLCLSASALGAEAPVNLTPGAGAKSVKTTEEKCKRQADGVDFPST